MTEPTATDSLLNDQSLRWERGERVLVEAYLARRPELNHDREALFDLIYHEILIRREGGETPRLDEYQRRFPAWSEDLEKLFDSGPLQTGPYEKAAGDLAVPSGPAHGSGPVDGPAFLDEVRRLGLVHSSQLDSLDTGPFAVALPLARELLRRGWLTPYQINQITLGKAGELVLGPYLLLEKLGAGGMGQVFKARHRMMDRLVALKVILPQYLARPEVVNRFHAEMRAVAALAHPNIVLAHHADLIGETLFLVMEFVEGIDLARLVKQRGPLPVAQACECIRQAALGLQHAFERGLVHRDIKPSNLILAAQGATLKILDLGLARLATVSSGQPATPVTGIGAVLGTPDFMSPEQALAFHEVDIRADIYSLGCTLYFLLTARPPFPTGSLAQKLLSHQQAAPAAVEGLRPDLPRTLPPVLHRMLAKSPADRYQTPAEVAAALIPFCPQAGAVSFPMQPAPGLVQAREKTPAEDRTIAKPGQGRAGRRRWAIGVGGSCALAGLAVLLAVLGQSGSDPDDPNGDPEKTVTKNGSIPPPRGLVAVLGEDRQRHWGHVHGVAINPRTGLVASGGADKVIRLWDPATGKERGILTGHTAPVLAVAFAPDGATLASGSIDQTVKLWEVSTGKEIATLKGHTERVWAVAFAPDNKTLASASADRTVKLWQAGSGKKLGTLRGHQGAVTSVAFAPDSKNLASGSADKTVKVWDVGRQQKVADLEPHADEVWSVAYSPQGKALASGSLDRSVRIWDTSTYRKPARFEGITLPVWSVAFADDGRSLALGGGDGLVEIWDVPRRKRMAAFVGHLENVRGVSLSRDGRTLASGSEEGVVRIWDVRLGHERRPLQGHFSPVLSVAYTADGKTLASGSADRTVKVWQVATRKARHTLKGHGNDVRAVAFASRGARLVSASLDRTVRQWDTATGDLLYTYPELPDAVFSVACAPNGRVAAGGGDKAIHLWDLAKGQPGKTLSGHTGAVRSLGYARDGGELVSGSSDGTARVWDLATGKEKQILRGHTSLVNGVAFAPDGKTLATASADGLVKLWDRATGARRADLKEHTHAVFAVAFAGDGKKLASAGEDGRVVLWATNSGKRLAGWELPGAVYSVAFSPDGHHLATGNANGTVYILRVEKTGE